MTWDDLLAYCLAKPGSWRDEPWDGDTVAKVGSKIYAFLGSGGDGSGGDGSGGDSLGVGVKCGASREEANEWLARYPDDARVMPYIGRSGWNTLQCGGAIPDEEILEAIDASYRLVAAKLPKRERPGV